MKTTHLITGIVIITSILSLTLTSSCQREEYLLEEAPVSEINQTTSNNQNTEKEHSIQALELEYNDQIQAQEGVSDDCKKVKICHTNGKLLNISINAAFVQVENGGMLFSCDENIGINYIELTTILTPRIIANGRDYSSYSEQKDEFLVWFYETYCGPDDSHEDDEEEGGTFDDDAGSDL